LACAHAFSLVGGELEEARGLALVLRRGGSKKLTYPEVGERL
jgi:hypothetical protein